MRRLMNFASSHAANLSRCFTQLMTRRSITPQCCKRSCAADRLVPRRSLRGRRLSGSGQRCQPDEIP
jgi:hypothetical protein